MLWGGTGILPVFWPDTGKTPVPPSVNRVIPRTARGKSRPLISSVNNRLPSGNASTPTGRPQAIFSGFPVGWSGHRQPRTA